MAADPREGRKKRLRARNARAVFFRDLRSRGLPEGADLSFLDLDNDPRGQELRDWFYRRLQGGPDEVEMDRPEEGLALAREWLRDRRGPIYCLIGDVGILAGAGTTFLEHFDLFGFLGDGNRDIVLATPALDAGFACMEFHGTYHAHAWRP